VIYMPFIKVDTKADIENRVRENPEFAKAYAVVKKEYDLISEAVSERKELSLTQGDIAELTGLKQQVISRIERVEHTPTLRSFLKYLDGIGLELKLEKKSNHECSQECACSLEK